MSSRGVVVSAAVASDVCMFRGDSPAAGTMGQGQQQRQHAERKRLHSSLELRLGG